MEKRLIKLLADWEGNPAGSILEVSDTLASVLVEAKTAEQYDPLASAAAQKAATEQAAAEDARIQSIVKQTVEEVVKAQPANPPTGVTKTHERIEDDPRHGFKGFGEFSMAVMAAHTQKGIDQRLLVKAPTGLGETVDSEGGFLVPDEFRAELLRKTYDASAVASKARTMPINSSVEIPYIAESSRADGSRSGGVRGYWVDEAPAAGITASKPTFGKLRLNLHKVAALVYVTDNLLSDSAITIDSLLSTLVSEELAFQVDDKFVNGTGAGQPLGVLTAPCTVSVAKETNQVAATIVTENIINMWARLFNRSRMNSVWFINQDIIPQLMMLNVGIGTAGMMTYMPPGGLSSSPYATLLGRPVIEIEQAATLGTVGDIILADMSQYIYAQKAGEGINAATSIHVRFIYDETAYRFTMRCDGQPWWSAALTPYKGGSNTVSPFITLATRA